MNYGRYEIKKVQETETMFSLDLYVDGEKFAAVSNDGRGGCHRIHTYSPFRQSDIERVEAEMSADEFLVDSEDEKFDSAITTLLVMRSAAKHIARVTKTKAMFLADGELNTIGYKDKRVPSQSLYDHVTKQHPTAVILNTLSPEDAIIAYVRHSRAEEAQMAAPPPISSGPGV